MVNWQHRNVWNSNGIVWCRGTVHDLRMHVYDVDCSLLKTRAWTNNRKPPQKPMHLMDGTCVVAFFTTFFFARGTGFCCVLFFFRVGGINFFLQKYNTVGRSFSKLVRKRQYAGRRLCCYYLVNGRTQTISAM